MSSNSDMRFIITDDSINKISNMEFGFMLFYIAYCILPSLGSKISFIYVLFLTVGYTAMIALNDLKLRDVIFKYLILIAIITVAYYFLVDTSGVSTYSSNYELKRFISKFNQYFSMFFPAVFAARIIMKGTYNQKKILLIASYAIVGFVVIVTMRELLINPDITRKFSGNFDNRTYENVGNYYFIYAIPLITSLVAMLFFHTEKSSVRCLLLFIIIFLFYFLIKSQFTLSILIAFVGVYYEFFKRIKTAHMKVITLLFSFIALFFVPFVLKFISENVESYQLATRFTELYNFFLTGDSSGYNLNGRLTLYGKSIMAFLRSPIIGNRSVDFDGHATLLTVPADLGLLGAVPLYYMFFKMKTHMSNLLGEKGYLFTPIFIMIILMGYTNPIHSSFAISITLYLIAPVTIEMLLNDGEEVSNKVNSSANVVRTTLQA